jgi:hypothetical protein
MAMADINLLSYKDLTYYRIRAPECKECNVAGDYRDLGQRIALHTVGHISDSSS